MNTGMNNGDSPFGGSGSRGTRLLKGGVYLAVLVAAAVGVYLRTRGTAAEPSAMTGHEHHGAAASADNAQPVMLTADQERRIGVTYAVASMTPLNREIRTVGQVTFDETRIKTISLRIDGWVERLFVDFTGQSVDSGAPLLSIYSPALVAAQEELLLAGRLERDVAGASTEVKRHADDLRQAAERRLRYWDIPPETVERIQREREIERTITLRAPTRGFVVSKGVLEGQKVAAGDALYTVADLSTVWIEGEVFEQDLPAVRLGQRVTAELQALPGQEFPGRISYIYPTLDPETHTARVRVQLPNPDVRLKPGMFATFRLKGLETPNAITVPRSAVLVTGQRNLVFVKRPDGMLEPRQVTVGLAGDARIEILRGLAVGDTVVASATFLVDAESNLGSVMGGMGDMPGMDITAPAGKGDDKAKKGEKPATGKEPDHSKHDMNHGEPSHS